MREATSAAPSSPAVTNMQLTQVYGQSHGWKMFDSRYLTDAVQTHLAHEVDGLNALLESFPDYQRFVEVGCGYGRLLEWSIEKGLSYEGLDLVSWMVQLGQVRCCRLMAQYPWAQASIHCVPAEAVDTLFPPAKISPPAVLFFPFNCLGNVTNVAEVLTSVARTPCDVIVSTFNTRPDTTAMRSEYYAHCGFSQLEAEHRDDGALVRSSEGLHTFAYTDAFYRSTFDRFGFNLETVLNVGKHGHLLYFKKYKAAQPQIALAEIKDISHAAPAPLFTGQVLIRLVALVKDVLPSWAKLPNQDNCLLTFEDEQHGIAFIKDDEINIETERNWSPGTMVRMEIIDPGALESTNRVAVVKRVLRKAHDRFQVSLWLYPA